MTDEFLEAESWSRSLAGMNTNRFQKIIVLGVILPAGLLVLGLRLYLQFRHVDVYVSRVAPLPPELASRLHMEEHGIARTCTIESPYDTAPEKILTVDEVRQLRKRMAWSSGFGLIDSLTILSPSNVVARRTIKGSRERVREFYLARRGDDWIVEDTREHGFANR